MTRTALPPRIFMIEASLRWASIIAWCPMGRHSTVEEIVDAVEFLASDKARFITGEILNVAGGFHIRP